MADLLNDDESIVLLHRSIRVAHQEGSLTSEEYSQLKDRLPGFKNSNLRDKYLYGHTPESE